MFLLICLKPFVIQQVNSDTLASVVFRSEDKRTSETISWITHITEVGKQTN